MSRQAEEVCLSFQLLLLLPLAAVAVIVDAVAFFE